MKRTLLYSIFGLACLAAFGCGHSGGASLANVNGDTITSDEFYSYLEHKPQVVVQSANGPAAAPVEGSLGFQAFDDLVQRHVVTQMAKDEGVWPTDADVVKEMDHQKKSDPDFVKKLNAAGFTLAMIKSDINLSLAQERLLTKGIVVTMDEVDKFIKDNPEQFRRPPTSLLQFVVVPPSLRASVDKDLGSGAMFGIVAQRYSIAPGLHSASGTHYPYTNLNDPQHFPAQLRTMIEKTPELKTTDWVPAGINFAKFYVEKKTASIPVAIDADVKENVRRSIARQRGTAANDLQKQIRERVLSGKITVDSPEFRDMWKAEMDKMKEVNAQPSVGAGGSGGPAKGPGK